MNLTATQAAKELDISAASLRRWASEFAQVLSADANPGPGKRRSYTGQDMALLHEAGRLFALGHTTTEVAGILATVELDELQPPTTTDEPANLPALPDTFERFTDALQTIASQKDRIDALERRLEALEVQERRSWWDRLRGR